MDNNLTEDPETIERDIRRTQEDMSRTVDKIGDQLTIKNVVNSLLDKADESGVDTHYLIDGARRNPMALGLIAAGAIWLVSEKDAKFPSMPSRSKKPQAGTKDELDLYGSDVHHRDYVTHMSGIEMRDGEDMDAYQRRRDLHRANFLMCERNPDEDDKSFRQRLNDLTDKFREKRSAWSDSASQTGAATRQRTQQLASSARDGARRASYRAQDAYSSNPLVAGIVAAAVGAAIGSAIPVSSAEQEKLGSLGRKAREKAGEQKEQLTQHAMEKKDEMLEKADEKLQQGREQSQPEAQRTQPEQQSSPEFASSSDGPFIISERSL